MGSAGPGSSGVPVRYGDYEFYVRDTGIGMSAEYQKHIFEQFSREETSTVSKTEGTGLGMPITKRLVEMMDGSIDLLSVQGQGTEFTVHLRLPLCGAPKKETPVADPEFAGMRLLVVEDNELNMEITTTVLEEAGFVVDQAINGQVALEKIATAAPGQYALVLMDIQMPVMDGYEATRRIRALPDPAKAQIPIVAMTANAFAEDRENALAAGMNEHIAKPFDIHTLLWKLAEILKKQISQKRLTFVCSFGNAQRYRSERRVTLARAPAPCARGFFCLRQAAAARLREPAHRQCMNGYKRLAPPLLTQNSHKRNTAY